MSAGEKTTPPSSGGGGTPAVRKTMPCPTLQIIDRKTSNVISGTTQTRIVGQKVELRVVSNPAATLSNITWTVGGVTVKNYTQTHASGAKMNLTAADLQNATLDFFWIDRAGNKDVSVRATANGCPLTTSVTVNLLRPTMNHFRITTASVNVTSAHFASPGNPVLCAFSPPSTYGSQWDAKVTAPANGAGQIGFTQKIEVKRRWVNTTGTARRYHSNGNLVLDNALGIQYSGPQPISASASATLSGSSYSDSPWIPLAATDNQASADEQFDLYLMYKHGDADAIWVTLGKTHWDWGGATTRNTAPGAGPNTWNAPTGAHLNPAGTTNAADSIELPEWTGNFGSAVWSSP